MKFPQAIFATRIATLSDAEVIQRIFNESVVGGGHSPVLTPRDSAATNLMMRRAAANNRPIWVVTTGGEVVAWCQLCPLPWGPETCHATADMSLYVAQSWQGSGAAGEALRRVWAELLPRGYRALTCTILGKNGKSRHLARALRLRRWALLPKVVDYGGLLDDVEIWGARLDDDKWIAHVDRILARHSRFARRGIPASSGSSSSASEK